MFVYKSYLFYLVRGRGLEPPRLTAYAPQAYMFTITPPAHYFVKYTNLLTVFFNLDLLNYTEKIPHLLDYSHKPRIEITQLFQFSPHLHFPPQNLPEQFPPPPQHAQF